MLEKCFGCGGKFEHYDGPIHNYMSSTAGCWQHYGQILAREYEDKELFEKAHRLTVDAYALQHPGKRNDRRAYQSVRIHYVSLHLIFVNGRSHTEATLALKNLVDKEYEPLPVFEPKFAFTVENVSLCSISDHVKQVEDWAKCAFDAWSPLKLFAEEIIQHL